MQAPNLVRSAAFTCRSHTNAAESCIGIRNGSTTTCGLPPQVVLVVLCCRCTTCSKLHISLCYITTYGCDVALPLQTFGLQNKIKYLLVMGCGLRCAAGYAAGCDVQQIHHKVVYHQTMRWYTTMQQEYTISDDGTRCKDVLCYSWYHQLMVCCVLWSVVGFTPDVQPKCGKSWTFSCLNTSIKRKSCKSK